MAKKKKKSKRKNYVFVKSANCASINVFASPGDVLQVGRTTVMLYGMRYPRAIEIDLYIRNKVLVPEDSEEAGAAAGARETLDKKRRPQGIQVGEDGQETVRGLSIDRDFDDYRVIPIVEKKVTPRRRGGRVDPNADVEEEGAGDLEAASQQLGRSALREAGSIKELVEQAEEVGKPKKSKVKTKKSKVKTKKSKAKPKDKKKADA